MSEEAFDSAALLAPATLPEALAYAETVVPFYVSTNGYTSQAGDTPAHVHFEGRLVSPFVFQRTILGASALGGRAAVGWGEIDLDNADGYYNALVRDYAIDGRRAVVRAGQDRAAYATFASVFDGTAEGWRRSGQRVRLRLRDLSWRLEVPLQTALYGGTGGADGPPSLVGVPKPYAIGYSPNVAPTPLGVIDLGDGPLATYQVSDGAVAAIPIVRIRGVKQTQASVAPAATQYRAWLAQGLFQLGSTPDGPVTCAVQGDAAGGYVSTAADILKRLYTTRGGLATSDLNLASFDELAFDEPGEMGFYFGSGERPLVADAIDRVLAAIVGYAGADRSNRISAGVLKPPDAAPIFTLYPEDVVSIVELEPPAYAYPPPSTVRCAYLPNDAPNADLAIGSLTSDEIAFLSGAAQFGSAFSSTVAANYLLAQQSIVIAGRFADRLGAERCASRLLALLSARRRWLKIVTDRYLGQIEVNHSGFVHHDDALLGLANGLYVRVLGWAENPRAGRLELTVIG